MIDLKFSKKTTYASYSALIALAIFIFGVYIGSANRPEIQKVVGVSDKQNPADIQTDFSPFWKVWNLLDEKNPDAPKESNQDKIYGAISGLVNSLGDPYTEFFTPDEAKMFESDIAGNFTGVGMEVGVKNGALTVIAPLKDTPAYYAGIKSGDIVLKIDGKDTSSMSVDEAIKLIRGPKGTIVTLSIFREGFKEPKDISITRDVINAPILDTEQRPDGIFVIHLYSFSANSASLFRNALQKFSNSGADKLILDLRGNPGGYLEAAVDMASWFLPAGKPVVIEDYGGNQKETIYRGRGYDVFNNNLKMAILIDGGSASASEILSGALRDYGKAVLVGEQSFGKGSVQEVEQVTPDTILKVTVAKWLTPNGISISKKGLTPDFAVPITQNDVQSRIDPQIEKAAEILNNWQSEAAGLLSKPSTKQ